jgi:[acyl-carrier-protein] S-malonyltransferase
MAAILGLESQVVRAGCAEAAQATGEVVEAVNFNDPKQTVIAGTKAAVDAACATLKGMGAKRALPLPVSAPFHCSLMKPAAEVLKTRLATTDFAEPGIPVINNIDVQVEKTADYIRDALYRQAFGPVRWVEVVRALRARGVTHVVECGPGKALSGMVSRIDAELVTGHVSDPASLEKTKELLA